MYVLLGILFVTPPWETADFRLYAPSLRRSAFGHLGLLTTVIPMGG